MKEVRFGIMAFIIWTAYKAKYDEYSFDGIKFEYSKCLVARWYSPTFWIVCICLLILTILDGALEGIRNIKDELTASEYPIGFQGSFKPNASWLRKRYLLFRFIYLRP